MVVNINNSRIASQAQSTKQLERKMIKEGLIEDVVSCYLKVESMLV